MPSLRRYELRFFTATILEWKPLLSNDLYKDIIIESLRFLVKENKIYVYAFVIMNNHIHVLWHVIHPNTLESVQRSFLRFSAQMIIKDLRNNNNELLSQYYVGAKDRKHQIWERNPLNIDIWSEYLVKQKLDYIHNNPVKAVYCQYPEEYRYSTAALYQGTPSEWDFVTSIYF